jgi:adenine-specific DNA-methyltransferase
VTGRLTLTWANKDRALLSHGESGYEWVDRDDPRAREVRLLDEIDRVGEVAGDASDNLLIRGDSLDALRALVHTPELAAEYRGRVKLVYIDPPFNTGQAFEHYDDSLEHSVWLGMMRERLVLIKELLSPEGSVWVHLDDAEMAYCKVLMDEIFGRSSFVSTVVWQKRYSRENRSALGSVHDSMLIYAPLGTEWKKVRNRLEREGAKEYRNPNNDPRGPWRLVPMTAQGYRPNQMYDIVAPNGKVHRPPKGRCWGLLEENYLKLLSEGRIRFGSDGNGQPGVLRYFDEDKGLVPWSWWPHDEVGHNDESKKEMLGLFEDEEAFATPKPERLLRRIVHIGSNPGDIVFDCFAGSGTSAAVAHKMGRRWVTVELSENTADTFTKPRLAKVVAGEDPGGITESAGWSGGGGFRDLRIAPSSWEVHAADGDLDVYRAESVSTESLTRSVAAQLGYRLIEDPVFSGARGRSRLVVIDGVADATAVTDIAAALAEGQTALVAATSVADDAQTTLRELSKGSRVLRIPRDLFPRTGAVTR